MFGGTEKKTQFSMGIASANKIIPMRIAVIMIQSFPKGKFCASNGSFLYSKFEYVFTFSWLGRWYNLNRYRSDRFFSLRFFTCIELAAPIAVIDFGPVYICLDLAYRMHFGDEKRSIGPWGMSPALSKAITSSLKIQARRTTHP